IKDAFEDTTDVFELLDKAERNLFDVSESNLRRNYADMRSLVGEAVREIQVAREHEEGLRGVPSGFTELDRVTSGWQKSDLIILASRPGMGKTAFALTIARNVAVDFKKPVAFFSLEMASIQLVTRLISSETQLPAEKLRRGNLEPHEWEQLNAKIEKLIEAPLFIDDTPALTIFELRAKCRRLKAQHNIELIIVDYLQLMSSHIEGKGNREQEISQISRSMKSLAKELNVPIITLSQLSRAVETRAGTKEPILSDLRESGAIEQDADLVLFIYRPEYYKLNEDKEGRSLAGFAQVNIAKHRNGALKNISLRFISQYAKFVDYDEDQFGVQPVDSFTDTNQESATYTIPSKMNDDATPF
ncbi:MAG: replicative DNA helicase, partial [Bacteroidales bacterium]|nr:replicative DNA helicase [Bacteroidales bacterium]